jgi:hypothetical protein
MEKFTPTSYPYDPLVFSLPALAVFLGLGPLLGLLSVSSFKVETLFSWALFAAYIYGASFAVFAWVLYSCAFAAIGRLMLKYPLSKHIISEQSFLLWGALIGVFAAYLSFTLLSCSPEKVTGWLQCAKLSSAKAAALWLLPGIFCGAMSSYRMESRNAS